MRKRQWGFILFIIIFLSICPGKNSTIYATDATDLEVIFVIDTSYSMNTTDIDRVSTEALNLFVDLNDNSKVKVGVVFYNDQVVYSQPLVSLDEVDDLSTLKEKLNSIPRAGFTDPGLGLHKGEELFSNNDNGKTKRAMILLTDGEIDLPSQSSRTKVDAENDIVKAIEHAKENEYPIYTVGLNSGGNLNNQQLEKIALDTGGTYFNAESADTLLEIFQSIFVELGPYTHYPITTLTASGSVQEVNVEIPYGFSEGNIVLLSERGIDEIQLTGQASISQQYQSNHYTLLKLKSISDNNLRLNFKGYLGDPVTISFLSNQNVSASLDIPDGEMVIDKPILVRATLENIIDQQTIELSANLEAELIVKHLQDGTEVRSRMMNTGSSFEVEQSFSAPGTYEAKVIIRGEDFYAETEPKTFELDQSQPLLLKSESITIKKGDKDTSINLNEYFSDPNEDKFTFNLIEIGNEKTVAATVKGSLLTLTPLEKGETTIDIHVTDQSGNGIISTLHITVENAVSLSYIMTIIGAVVLSVGLLFIWYIRQKDLFVGRLEAVFYQTEGRVFPSRKYWPLKAFNNRKRVTLYELFSRLEIQEDLPGANHITFYAGSRGELKLKHDSRCIVMKGGSIVPRKEKVVIKHNEKLYITFEDGNFEVELLYKANEKHEIIESYSYSN